jgi:hypothetical protein
MTENERKELLREITTAVLTEQLEKVIPTKAEILTAISEGTERAISNHLPQPDKE